MNGLLLRVLRDTISQARGVLGPLPRSAMTHLLQREGCLHIAGTEKVLLRLCSHKHRRTDLQQDSKCRKAVPSTDLCQRGKDGLSHRDTPVGKHTPYPSTSHQV